MIITDNINSINLTQKVRQEKHCRIPFCGDKLQSGDVIDIKARGKYPSNVLSNFAKTNFEIDGVKVSSIEGFLQSLKTNDPELQKKICQMNGFEAKEFSKRFKRRPEEVLCFWDEKVFSKSSPEFKQLINQVLDAKNKTFDGQKFKFAGYDISSINSFIMGLKSNNQTVQKQLFLVPESEVREVSKTMQPKYCPRTLYWNGKTFSRNSEDYKQLLDKVYKARYKHDFSFRKALRIAKKSTLTHSIGKADIGETILTEKEFLKILRNLQDGDKFVYKCLDCLKRLYH